MVFFSVNNPFMDIHKIIADNLNQWIASDRWLNNSVKVAAKSTVGTTTVNRIRRADGNVTAKNIEALAAAFRRNPADLLCTPESVKTYPTRIEADEPPPAEVYKFPQPLLNELMALAEKIDDAGLHRLIGQAGQILEQFPREHKGKSAQ